MAALRPVRGRPEREGHPRLRHVQVQGLRVRHHDPVRGGAHGHPEPERVHPGQPRATGVLQG